MQGSFDRFYGVPPLRGNVRLFAKAKGLLIDKKCDLQPVLYLDSAEFDFLFM